MLLENMAGEGNEGEEGNEEEEGEIPKRILTRSWGERKGFEPEAGDV
jgi:hypothetical protein